MESISGLPRYILYIAAGHAGKAAVLSVELKVH